MQFDVTRKFAAASLALALAACGGGTDDLSSDSGSGSSSSSSQSLAACGKLTYNGDKSDPQVYTFDAQAMLLACEYRATGDAQTLNNGNKVCLVLDDLLKSTSGTFRPLYCSGSRLKV